MGSIQVRKETQRLIIDFYYRGTSLAVGVVRCRCLSASSKGKNRLEALRLEDVVVSLREFLLPVIAAARSEIGFTQHWKSSGPWTPAIA
ncbi:hypothetical protein [Rhodocyclus gracilis]|uniref:hypothetical protein n=1 Tax=Rhodocyclus gracilis TaxID=2929842 RepID=UPI001ADA6241|nr:hypothetical protein [Rhodocyclus gracilis]